MPGLRHDSDSGPLGDIYPEETDRADSEYDGCIRRKTCPCDYRKRECCEGRGRRCGASHAGSPLHHLYRSRNLTGVSEKGSETRREAGSTVLSGRRRNGCCRLRILQHPRTVESGSIIPAARNGRETQVSRPFKNRREETERGTRSDGFRTDQRRD